MSRVLQLLADTSPEVPGTRTIIIYPGPDPWVPGPWVPWAIGIFLFFCAAFIAYRRAAPAAQDVPRRRRRILLTGLTWATMFALMFAPQQYAKPWGSPFWLSLLLVTAVLFLLGTTILGGLDLILDYFRPLRRREWLAIGPLLFAVIVPATIFGLGLGPSGGLLAQAGPGPVALAAAAAGLVWWAWLPALDASLAYVFE